MATTPRLTRGAAATVAVVLALAVTACGDDGDASADAPADTQQETGDAEATATEDVEIDETALQAVLDEWRTEVDAYGATMSIRMPGHDDINLASGIDGRDPETPMPTDGTYWIGTNTRPFVAAAALQLVDEGRVALDDSVEPWLPELPDADEITLAMLLDFTSGLPQMDDAADVELVTADLGRTFAPEELLAIQLEQPVGAPPGEEFGVGIDTGYIAAGLLIERVLDQDLATVIDERFARPLGLDDTVFGDGTVKPTRHAWFSLDGDPDRPVDFLALPHEAIDSHEWASRNMLSSTADMLDWGEALYSGEVLGEENTATMVEMRNSSSPRQHYGLGAGGYCLDEAGCDPADPDVVGHLGGFAASDSIVAYHPPSGATVAVWTNVTIPDEDGYPDPLFDLVGDTLAELDLT